MTLQTLKNQDALKAAEHFLRICVQRGLAHSFDTVSGTWVKPYPEVTGYILSYFADHYPRRMKDWMSSGDTLVDLQGQAGGFASFYDPEYLYAFDTAQIMHGLLSLYRHTKEKRYLASAVRAGEFLQYMQLNGGLMFPLFNAHEGSRIVYQPNSDASNWGSTFSYIQVKNAEGLQLLAKITGDKRYQQSALALAEFPVRRIDYSYTHPLAYYLEGLWSMGKTTQVKQILEQKIIPRLKDGGFIPYFPKAAYAYTSGSIQLAILLAKTKHLYEARQILTWAQKVQSHHGSGGLFQYALPSGEPDGTIHREINSWGTKYFAELLRLVN